MIERAKKVAEVFKAYGIAYLFIGKFGAILYGYPGTTQDIDVYASKDPSNCEKLVNALGDLGFTCDAILRDAILRGKDFIQIRGGPFPLDIIFAPDGIESFEVAQTRAQLVDNLYQCASIDDIIESKRATGRQRDKEEIPRLLLFRDALRRRPLGNDGSH
jgi:hypothetical protein